jgi:hypothetical protein
MECVPMASQLVVRLAMLALTAALPSTVEPSLKVIVPDACPLYRDVMAAVKVTDWPGAEGLTLEHSARAVLSLLMVMCTPRALLGAKLVSP